MAELQLLEMRATAGRVAVEILGDRPSFVDEPGRAVSRPATVVPGCNVLITLPGTHADQRLAYYDHLDDEYGKAGHEPLSREDRAVLRKIAVDLFIRGDEILIRPEPGNMESAFQADEFLQQLRPKHKIKFLRTLNQDVRDAIRRRGELWRIMPLPRSREEMDAMILESRVDFDGVVYYYNKNTGTRFLTCQVFSELPAWGDLRPKLLAIQSLAARGNNAHGHPEMDFFAPGGSFSRDTLASCDFATMDEPRLEAAFRELRERFDESVAPDFRSDDLGNAKWRSRMFATLIGEGDTTVSEDELFGLAAEFSRQVSWVPGARIEDGELILDSVFCEDEDGSREDDESKKLRDMKARKLITNYLREYADLEYINVGRIDHPLAQHPPFPGRRVVYVVEMKRRGSDRPMVRVVRWQKWAVREHLRDGRSFEEAMCRAEEYTDFVLDRRLGCHQLRMNLPPVLSAKKMCERYYPKNDPEHSFTIPAAYFERDYIYGIATDKLPLYKFQDQEYAVRFARLLGEAAASSMIVGRCDPDGVPMLDRIDEILVEDEKGMPQEIVVAEHAGTFANYLGDLREAAREYAGPINRRLRHVPDPRAFAAAYLEAFEKHFWRIQQDYRKRRKAFHTLFAHRCRDARGSFGYRWEKVLERLDAADPKELADLIRQNVELEQAKNT